jgi:hypothetical protein
VPQNKMLGSGAGIEPWILNQTVIICIENNLISIHRYRIFALKELGAAMHMRPVTAHADLQHKGNSARQVSHRRRTRTT